MAEAGETTSKGGGFSMTSFQRSVATLLIGSGALLLGYGMQVTILPIRAQLEGFSTTLIGLMGTAYFGGFMLGCVLGPAAVKRVGHIRCFAGFAALAAAATLVFPVFVDPIAWCLLRAFTGVCFAVLYMVIESWLNDQSSNENRGRVLSLYIIVTNVMTIGGQLMVNLTPITSTVLFSLMAIFVCLALVTLSLTPTSAPKPIAAARLDIAKLFRLSPAGFVGCLIVGLVEGAFWSLGPVFAQGSHMSIAEVTLFMSAFVVGGTLSQWPLGRLSDRIDRRLVIAGCALGTVFTGLAMAFFEFHTINMTLALAILHGGFMIPIYALALAHVNDHAPNDALVATSGGMLLIYAVGAVVGPAVAAPLMEAFGLGTLFLFMAVLLGALALFSLYRARVQPKAAAGQAVEFVPVPKTTPSVYALEQDDNLLEADEGTF
jgi:MFS family permease